MADGKKYLPCSDKTFLQEPYPSLKQVFEKYAHRIKKWPYYIHEKR